MTRIPSPPSGAPRRDSGAALIIAIGFVMMIGAIGAGLTAMVTSGVGNRLAIEEIRDRQYAADGAVEEAISQVRVTIEDGTVACGSETVSTASLNGVDVRVDRFMLCGATRDVWGLPAVDMAALLEACVDEGVPCADGTVIVRAFVGFEFAHDGHVARAAVRSWSVLR